MDTKTFTVKMQIEVNAALLENPIAIAASIRRQLEEPEGEIVRCYVDEVSSGPNATSVVKARR